VILNFSPLQKCYNKIDLFVKQLPEFVTAKVGGNNYCGPPASIGQTQYSLVIGEVSHVKADSIPLFTVYEFRQGVDILRWQKGKKIISQWFNE